jgi:hypothetical protein
MTCDGRYNRGRHSHTWLLISAAMVDGCDAWVRRASIGACSDLVRKPQTRLSLASCGA